MSSVQPAGERSESGPLPLGGGRRRRARRVRRGGDEVPVGGNMQGGDLCADGQVSTPENPCDTAGGRRMTRKQRASVKKVARALKSANKKAQRLAMTLKKKLGRGRP